MHLLNKHVLSAYCVPDSTLRTEDIWDGDRLVLVSTGQQDKTIAVCGDRGRSRYVAAIWNTVAAKKVTLMYLEGERRTSAF